MIMVQKEDFKSGACACIEEIHPFPPYIPGGARILICGTFPPKSNRWSMEFYYPNFINDMWRIFGKIFFDDVQRLVDRENKTFRLGMIKLLLDENGIALSDTGARAVRLRDNASDKWLDITEPLDLAGLIRQMPDCHDICTTGEKASQVMATITGGRLPGLGDYSECEFDDGLRRRNLRHWRMPSSSRAFPMKLEIKAGFYRSMFETAGIIRPES